jgi:hypothetical protein
MNGMQNTHNQNNISLVPPNQMTTIMNTSTNSIIGQTSWTTPHISPSGWSIDEDTKLYIELGDSFDVIYDIYGEHRHAIIIKNERPRILMFYERFGIVMFENYSKRPVAMENLLNILDRAKTNGEKSVEIEFLTIGEINKLLSKPQV